jgi:eukaryotic-like serine/threonine-protein kinase
MGAVYEVEHLHTGQRLALKVLTSQPGASVERFKREARAASLIRSDHIVRVTDADVAPELGGAPFLVMDLLVGADLERATRNRPTAPGDVVEWLRQVARALGKAHEAGLVHRDLKPENLFLTEREDGTPLVKILDFGIAKMTAEGGLTASDAFLGTPGYMAPEQTDSKGPPITPRADLYALGLIAFKLLTGRVYWITGSLAQLLAQILALPMPPASERGATLGPTFDAWFAKACDRNPENRFASAEEQVEALAEALSLPARRSPDLAARSSAPPVAGTDKQGSSSLNGSTKDLLQTRKRIRQRVLGGGLVAVVVTAGVGAAVLRAGPTRSRISTAETALVSSVPPPQGLAVIRVPDTDAATAVVASPPVVLPAATSVGVTPSATPPLTPRGGASPQPTRGESGPAPAARLPGASPTAASPPATPSQQPGTAKPPQGTQPQVARDFN